MPKVRLVNPSRRRRRASNAKRRKRRMPAALRAYWAAKRAGSRPNAGGGHMARKSHRRRSRNRHSVRRRRRVGVSLAPRRRHRSNPSRYIMRRSRRRNAGLSFAGFRSGDLLWLGGGALLNGIVTRALPQTLLPQYNVSWIGYGMNVIAGSAGAYLISKFNHRAGQGAWVGMIVAVG